MSDISPMPWKVNDEGGMFFNNICIFDRDNQFIVKLEKVDAEHVIKCVNEHNQLQQQNKRLIETLFDSSRVPENQQLRIKIERLVEALRRCDPFLAHTGSKLHVCEFCFDNPHTDDCEYLQLTKEAGNV